MTARAMYIEEVNIRGYGRLSNFRLEPSRGLNILHGPAGVGKSTVCNCLRDMLVGPGRWDSTEGGPRAPYALPWSGDRFQARMRYAVGPTSYTLLRDFDEMSVRARDDAAGKEIPVADPRSAAPGVVPFHLDETAQVEEPGAQGSAQQRLQAARDRAAGARREAATWEWRMHRAQVTELEGRLRKAADMEREALTLRPQLAQQERYSGMQREHRDAVIRASARIHTLERELADGQRILDTHIENRREVGVRLAAFERFFTVTPDDLEMVKTLDLVEGPSSAQIEEKQKNLEGFAAKEGDIRTRFEELAGRFKNVDSEEAFELELNDLEREVGRTEMQTARLNERDRLKEQIVPLEGSGRRFILYAVLLFAMGAVSIGMEFALKGALHMAGAIGGAIMLAIGVGAWVKRSSDEARRRDLESERARVQGDIDKLQSTIDAARDRLRAILAAAGVHTIKDLRTLHREYRSLQRDSETVRAYSKELERDLELARQKSTGKKLETPRLLVECAILKEGDSPTPRAVADFFEAYHNFKALQQEEDGLKKRLSQAQTDLADKTQERDSLKATHEQALQALGLASETEMDAAFAGKREYDRVKAELDVLEEKIRGSLRGLTTGDATRKIEESRARLADLEQTYADLGDLDAIPEKLDEYRAKFHEAHQQAAMVAGEIAALEGGTAPPEAVAEAQPVVTGVNPERLERRVAEAWQQITGRSVGLRVRDAQGRIQVEIREKPDGPWLPSATLGSLGMRLIGVLVEGESARVSGAGALPAFVDNPFQMLEPDWQDRLADWLVELALAVQTFVTLSTSEARDRLKQALDRRGMALTEMREDNVEILTAASPVAAPG